MVGDLRIVTGKLVSKSGAPFFWLGDTHWFAMTSRCSLEQLETILKLRKKQGFTVFQTVVGVPPEVDPWSPNAANSGGYPFLKDGSVNKNYFAEVDAKLALILEYGFTPCIFGAWGYQIDIIGYKTLQTWWQEILDRYAKLPVIFCVTGEVDLFPTGLYGEGQTVAQKQLHNLLPESAKNFARKALTHFTNIFHKRKLQKRLQLWNKLGMWIAAHDPFHRPLTIHPHSMHSARELFPNAKWLTINAIQSGHSLDRLEYMQQKTKQETQYPLPFVNLEPWYEGIFGKFGPKEQELALRTTLENGGIGMTYGAQGLWNMSTKLDPFLTHWGEATWEEGLQAPGAEVLIKVSQVAK